MQLFSNNRNADLKTGLEKLSLFYDDNSSKQSIINASETSSNIMMEGARESGHEYENEKVNRKTSVRCLNDQLIMFQMEEDCDITAWCNTMSPRYKCEEGECSVQSCLNQFTACELLTANNKVNCELCTKRHGAQNNTVYTIATKQLLVFNPPAVLILHLKRFQVF